MVSSKGGGGFSSVPVSAVVGFFRLFHFQQMYWFVCVLLGCGARARYQSCPRCLGAGIGLFQFVCPAFSLVWCIVRPNLNALPEKTMRHTSALNPSFFFPFRSRSVSTLTIVLYRCSSEVVQIWGLRSRKHDPVYCDMGGPADISGRAVQDIWIKNAVLDKKCCAG